MVALEKIFYAWFFGGFFMSIVAIQASCKRGSVAPGLCTYNPCYTFFEGVLRKGGIAKCLM
jgi:hypothetical protein